MTKEQMQYYQSEFHITDYDIFNALDDMDTLHIYYKYNSKNAVEAGKRLDRALQKSRIDDIFNAIEDVREHGGAAPRTAEVHAIDAEGIYNIGTLFINEDTYYFINEWEDEAENYDI